jgi:hypothetical protein
MHALYLNRVLIDVTAKFDDKIGTRVRREELQFGSDGNENKVLEPALL